MAPDLATARPFMRGVEAVEKGSGSFAVREDMIGHGEGGPVSRGAENAMARYVPYNYKETKLIPVSLKAQRLEPLGIGGGLTQ